MAPPVPVTLPAVVIVVVIMVPPVIVKSIAGVFRAPAVPVAVRMVIVITAAGENADAGDAKQQGEDVRYSSHDIFSFLGGGNRCVDGRMFVRTAKSQRPRHPCRLNP